MSSAVEHKTRISRGRDNNSCLPLGGWGCLIGEVPGFVPTLEELEVLAKYYAESFVRDEADGYVYGMSFGGARKSFCCERLDRIDGVLGKGVVDKLLQEAWNREGDLDAARLEYERWEAARHGQSDASSSGASTDEGRSGT